MWRGAYRREHGDESEEKAATVHRCDLILFSSYHVSTIRPQVLDNLVFFLRFKLPFKNLTRDLRNCWKKQMGGGGETSKFPKLVELSACSISQTDVEKVRCSQHSSEGHFVL